MTFKGSKRTGTIPAQPRAGIAPATAFRAAKAKAQDEGGTPRKRLDGPSPSTSQPAAPPVVGLNGEDITDYV